MRKDRFAFPLPYGLGFLLNVSHLHRRSAETNRAASSEFALPQKSWAKITPRKLPQSRMDSPPPTSTFSSMRSEFSNMMRQPLEVIGSNKSANVLRISSSSVLKKSTADSTQCAKRGRLSTLTSLNFASSVRHPLSDYFALAVLRLSTPIAEEFNATIGS
jgi:hypothetical protein